MYFNNLLQFVPETYRIHNFTFNTMTKTPKHVHKKKQHPCTSIKFCKSSVMSTVRLTWLWKKNSWCWSLDNFSPHTPLHPLALASWIGSKTEPSCWSAKKGLTRPAASSNATPAVASGCSEVLRHPSLHDTLMASLRQLRATWIANSLSPRRERDLPSPMYRNVESSGTSAAPHHITLHLQVNEYLTKEHVNSFVIHTHNFLSGECVSYISTVSKI